MCQSGSKVTMRDYVIKVEGEASPTLEANCVTRRKHTLISAPSFITLQTMYASVVIMTL